MFYTGWKKPWPARVDSQRNKIKPHFKVQPHPIICSSVAAAEALFRVSPLLWRTLAPRSSDVSPSTLKWCCNPYKRARLSTWSIYRLWDGKNTFSCITPFVDTVGWLGGKFGTQCNHFWALPRPDSHVDECQRGWNKEGHQAHCKHWEANYWRRRWRVCRFILKNGEGTTQQNCGYCSMWWEH